MSATAAEAPQGTPATEKVQAPPEVPRHRGPLVWLSIAASAVVVVVFIVYAVFLAARASSDIEDVSAAQPFAGPASVMASNYSAGRQAPDFAFTALTGAGTLEGREGQSVHLADFAGRPVWVNIFASWCAPCRAEMPDLN